jgi:CTP synthase (UTP-ammonia lyase)
VPLRPSAGPELRDKLSMFCNVPVKAVIECRDVPHSIYELPLALQKEGMDTLVLRTLRAQKSSCHEKYLGGDRAPHRFARRTR